MAIFIALLRAINVGGTGMLPMKELSAMSTQLGFENVRTYIQSGNVIFESALAEKTVQAQLEEVLTKRMGKKVDVVVRTASELRSILKGNPFAEMEPAKVAVMFLSSPVPAQSLKDVVGPGGEKVRARDRQIYIYYPDGMGRSKLKLPSLGGPATVRNINTVTKLVAMTEKITQKMTRG
ncbi:MAG: DUF1697 domain-containing protein [Bryobacteraceae bacterium]